MKSRSSSEPRKPTTNNDQGGKKRKTYNPLRPCYYCSELGHWTPTCPVKIKANESRLKFKQQANVASFDTSPQSSLSRLFCTLVRLTQYFKKNSQWFLPFSSPLNISAITPIPYNSLVSHDQRREKADRVDLNLLWHRQMGHLSIRNFNRIMKFNTVIGIKPLTLQKIGVCHLCSIAKSKNINIKNPPWQMIKKAGDVIVADLMGPLPLSMNNMKYILMIQDAFSRVVVAIPLMDKSEAKTKLQNWIIQFTNVTDNKIKVVRTDNRSKLKNNNLGEFLKNRGIIHEFAMPYKHHQNGNIE
ncbi:hypothetical protein O181_066127 [Austropuccinia psidii MF-1]|uniref:Integrase catalytic domain-containing protein n=1 Tax=Austropuccinia psidii MF-1 TaxID=1389203 RepID=A0A9Q3EYL1_9BASI|nr:hypothetical protein [Austropuccinia psidii MF-1]